jgi:hypothetical protein
MESNVEYRQEECRVCGWRYSHLEELEVGINTVASFLLELDGGAGIRILYSCFTRSCTFSQYKLGL